MTLIAMNDICYKILNNIESNYTYNACACFFLSFNAIKIAPDIRVFEVATFDWQNLKYKSFGLLRSQLGLISSAAYSKNRLTIVHY